MNVELELKIYDSGGRLLETDADNGNFSVTLFGFIENETPTYDGAELHFVNEDGKGILYSDNIEWIFNELYPNLCTKNLQNVCDVNHPDEFIYHQYQIELKHILNYARKNINGL